MNKAIITINTGVLLLPYLPGDRLFCPVFCVKGKGVTVPCSNQVVVMIKFADRLRIRDFLSTCTQIISGAGFYVLQ